MAASNRTTNDQLFNTPSFAKLYSSAEKITGPFAESLLEQAGIQNVDPTAKLVIQDNACGTGILTSKLLDVLDQVSKESLAISCTDKAEAMVNVVKGRIQDANWKGVKAFVADAQDTQLPSSHFTHIFTHFGIMLFPDPNASLRECYRMLKSDGILALSTWKSIGWYADHQAAFAADPTLPPLPPAAVLSRAISGNHDADWSNAQAVADELKRHGFVDIDVREVSKSSTLDNVDEYLAMMPGMMKMILSAIYNEEEMAKYNNKASETVGSYMKEKYGNKPVTWDWIAILATAKKPTEV